MDINSGINPVPRMSKSVNVKASIPASEADPFAKEWDALKAKREKAGEESQAQDTDFMKQSDQYLAQIEQEHKARDAELDAKIAAAPHPPEQVFQYAQKDISGLTSMLLVLSALGGALTRAPFTASLNNLNAAFKGVIAGNQQQFENEYKQFEANFKSGQEAHKNYMDDLKFMQEKYKGDHASMLEAYHQMQLKHGILKDRSSEQIKSLDQEMKQIWDQELAHRNAMQIATMQARTLAEIAKAYNTGKKAINPILANYLNEQRDKAKAAGNHKALEALIHDRATGKIPTDEALTAAIAQMGTMGGTPEGTQTGAPASDPLGLFQ